MGTNMSEDNEFLLEEYKILHSIVEDIDRRRLLIKSWSITVALAVCGVGLTTSASPRVFLLVSVASVCFLLLEIMYNIAMQAHYRRIDEIEAIAPSARRDAKAPAISRSWTKHFAEMWRLSNVLRMMFLRAHVHLPHSVLFAIGLVLWSYESHILTGLEYQLRAILAVVLGW
jgi:hypothetical protein